MKAVDTAASRMPIWALTTIAFVFVSYIGVLGAVAIFSERDVEFFPPKIGSGPKTKLVGEFSEMRKDIKVINKLIESHITSLYTQLNDARAKESSATTSYEKINWQVNQFDIQEDIIKYENKISSEINGFTILVKETEAKLMGL
jgi:hypothetical protein